MKAFLAISLAAAALAAPAPVLAGDPDPRRFEDGRLIPDEGYCDQPYVVVTKDGSWLCTLTTGKGREGDRGQHVVAAISADQGRTWSGLIDIEPADGPEASWAIPLVAASGRVYVFYDYNGDRVDRLPGGAARIRADMLGWYCYRFSDDGGRTWSADRRRLPLRVTDCDRANQWGGAVQVFWGIDKPKAAGGAVCFGFTKLGRYMLDEGEGWLFRSENILTEPEVEKIRWEVLPEGERGIRAPEFGSIQEEHNLVPLGDGKLYCVYRTALGHPCHAYSDDGGRTWTRPEPMAYSPGGRRVRNPRACPKLWRTAGGKYLFWFHNCGEKGFNEGERYGSRNIAWLSGGKVEDGRLRWSQPEIVRYCAHPLRGCSYPDLLEQDGRFFLSTTQKTEARIEEVDPALLEGLWKQDELRAEAEGSLARFPGSASGDGKMRMPRLPDLAAGGGFAAELWVRLEDLSPGQVLLDSRSGAGPGIAVTSAPKGALRLEISDGAASAAWDTDPGLLEAGKVHQAVFIVDGGPKVISTVVDGVLCDGGNDDRRRFGYGRFLQTRYSSRDSEQKTPAREIGDVSGGPDLVLGKAVQGLRLYGRALRTSEAVGNFRAGPPPKGPPRPDDR